jgi:hypothetical protein
LGVLNLSPQEFLKLTLAEYRAKVKGFSEYEQSKAIANRFNAWWIGRCFCGKGYPEWDKFNAMFSGEDQKETSDEENIEEAKKLGLKGPWSEEE